MALQSPVSEQLISDFENTDIAHLRCIHYVHHREQRILRGGSEIVLKKKRAGKVNITEGRKGACHFIYMLVERLSICRSPSPGICNIIDKPLHR